MSQLDDLFEDFIEPRVLVLLDDEEYVVKLILDGAGVHQSGLVVGQIPPVLLLPEELYPHLMCPRRLVSQASLVVVAVQMSDVPELLPLVEDFQALDEESLPDPKVELTDFVVWAMSRELSRTHQVLDGSLKVFGVPFS